MTNVTDFADCESEPIHTPGAIQPHGVLIAVGADDGVIYQISANVESFLAHGAAELIGSPVSDLAADATTRRALEGLARGSGEVRAVGRLSLRTKPGVPVDFHAVAHRSGPLLVVELESVPATATDDRQITLATTCRDVFERLDGIETVPGLCDRLADEVARFTGYDRVMIYRFDDEWNGEVIAERRADELEPYLGLWYPASDIPAIARRLLELNVVRIIADVDAPAAALIADNRTSAQPLDLGQARLRSVSPVHIEYLRNMGVGASLTISLKVKGRLWGLIACHHRTPKPICSPAFEIYELLGRYASLRLAQCLDLDETAVAAATEAVLARLTGAVQSSSDPGAAMLDCDRDALSLVNAAGVAVYRAGHVLSVGSVPPADIVETVAKHILLNCADAIFHTDRLAKLMTETTPFASTAAGALAVVVSRSPDFVVLWFRPETLQTVTWGGDPRKPVSQAGTGRLHPRRSFAAWKEIVRDRSLPWRQDELHAAKRLRTTLQEALAGAAERLVRLLPICSWCKKIRSDQGYWDQVDEYIGQNLNVSLTHGICPGCLSEQLRQLSHDQSS